MVEGAVRQAESGEVFSIEIGIGWASIDTGVIDWLAVEIWSSRTDGNADSDVRICEGSIRTVADTHSSVIFCEFVDWADLDTSAGRISSVG